MANIPPAWQPLQARTAALPSQLADAIVGTSGSLRVRVVQGGDGTVPLDAPNGVLRRSLNRRRRRYIRLSECVLVEAAGRPVGLAAYHRVESEVRLVMEFLLDPDLGETTRDEACAALIAGLETGSHNDNVQCLMVMVEPNIPLEPFRHLRFSAIAIDTDGAWLQKHFWNNHRQRSRTCAH